MKMVAIGFATALALPATAQAAAFMNGDFETGTNPAGYFFTVDSSSDAITGWTVTSGTVQYKGGYWQAGDGNRSIDLNGISTGALAQTFDTVAGTTYTVNFMLAGNPDGGPALKTLEVGANGNAAQQYTFDVTGFSRTEMGWEDHSYIFTAAGASTTLSFASLTDGEFYGPALDGVTVTALPVPEPAVWALMLTGFALVGTNMRRRHRMVQFA